MTGRAEAPAAAPRQAVRGKPSGARWGRGLRLGVLVGAPLAAGMSTGARGLGAVAAVAALAVALSGEDGTGLGARARSVAVGIAVGVAAVVGSLAGALGWVAVALLAGGVLVLAAARRLDDAAALVALALLLGLLVGTAVAPGALSALELVVGGALAAAFAIGMERAWPTSAHPVAELTAVRGIGAGVALAAVPLVYAAALALPGNAVAPVVAGGLALGLALAATARPAFGVRDAIVLGALLVLAVASAIGDLRPELAVPLVAAAIGAGALSARGARVAPWCLPAACALLTAAVG